MELIAGTGPGNDRCVPIQVKSLLRKHDAEHESALAAERRRARHAIKDAVGAMDRDRRREAAAAISAIRQEKDEVARQALAIKDVELRDRLEKASTAARAAIEGAESRARSAGTKAQALARDSAEKVRSMQQERADALGVAQEKFARLERKHEEETRRLHASAEALATERDNLTVDRDTAIAKASRQRGLLDEERRARELAMNEAQDLFLSQRESAEKRFREATARGKQEALEAEKGERQRLVDEAVRRKDREMAKALKVPDLQPSSDRALGTFLALVVRAFLVSPHPRLSVFVSIGPPRARWVCPGGDVIRILVHRFLW